MQLEAVKNTMMWHAIPNGVVSIILGVLIHVWRIKWAGMVEHVYECHDKVLIEQPHDLMT